MSRVSMKDTINKPRISKFIGGMYVVSAVIVLIIFAGVTLQSGILSGPLYAQIFFFGIMISVSSLMALLAFSFYRTRYAISNGVLHSWSPLAVINLKLKDIKKVERTLVPFYIRIGASFYSGFFYIPGRGWTRTIITNLTDGVLITTKNKKHYLITPSNPDRFAKLLKNR